MGELQNLILLSVLILAAAEDVRKMKISNRLIASGFILGLACRVFGEGPAGIIKFLMDISLPVIFLFLLYHVQMVGAGDIKLFSVVSGFITIKPMPYLVFMSFFMAALYGIVKKLYLICAAGHKWKSRTTIHFSFFIMFGYLSLVWG